MNSHFEGNYVMGKKTGEGKFVWADGSVYEGCFQDNNLHGQGKYTFPDGRSYEGEWSHNKRLRQLMILEKAWDRIYGLMEKYIKANLKMIKRMVQEPYNFLMEENMQENG